jgi:hypothetical protein
MCAAARMTSKLGHCGDTTTPNFKKISVLHRIVAYVVPYPIGTEIREPAMSTFPELVDLFMIFTVQLIFTTDFQLSASSLNV